MDSDKDMKLQDAVNMDSWTHNTNRRGNGFYPLELVTGKAIKFPGISEGDISNHTEYGCRDVKDLMKRHYQMMDDYVQSEYQHKILEINRLKEFQR